MATAFAFNTPFQQQVDYLVQKLRLPTERYDDITGRAHDKAFVVAGAAKADLLADLQAAIIKAARDGGGLEAFRKDFKSIVAKHGWTGWTGSDTAEGIAWRTRVIYQTNMATSYAAGRYQQMSDPEVLKLHPYWRYIHSDHVLTPRPQHVAWHGLTLPADHPFWKTHYVPNGYGCQCRITSVTRSEGEASARAGLGEPPEGWDTINPKTGAPVGIDKGFAYAPGANVKASLQSLVDNKLITLPANLGSAMWEALKPALELEARTAAFSAWAQEIRASGRTTGAFQVVQAIDPKVLTAMETRSVLPASAEIVVRDEDVWHTFRDNKASALPWEWYLELPTQINTPRAVVLDTSHADGPALLYIFDLPGSATARMVLKLDYTVTVKGVDGIKRKKTMNVLRTGSIVEAGDLKNPAKYELLAGEL